jgi:hypothetical protein
MGMVFFERDRVVKFYFLTRVGDRPRQLYHDSPLVRVSDPFNHSMGFLVYCEKCDVP